MDQQNDKVVVVSVSETNEARLENGLDSGQKMGATGDPNSEESRAEIDTSAPFESVKEAATRFGGIGFWRPTAHKQPSRRDSEVTDKVAIAKVEEQAAQLERDLVVKERETLAVLKELESAKTTMEELKVKLQKASELSASLDVNSEAKQADVVAEVAAKERNGNLVGSDECGLNLCPSSAPGLILLELKQAKFNLTKTTRDLVDIRATVESYNAKIEKERSLLEKTKKRLASNFIKVSSLEEELNQTKRKLEQVQDCNGDSHEPLDVTRELQRLSSETEQFRKVGEATKSEVLRAMSEIEQTKARIKTAEIRLIAAKKMKEAARATESVALAEIKAFSNSESLFTTAQRKPEDGITLTLEEYSSLTSRARDAEEACERRAVGAMLLVEEANVTKTEILKKVEEATEEVKLSKRALEEALSRVEAANQGKLEVEEAMRKWRSDHCQRKHAVQNSTKFKNSKSSQHRKDLLDVNGLTLVNNEAPPALKSTLSIGQILSRKLLLTEEFENGRCIEKSSGKRKVSLAQMLGKLNSMPNLKDEKENAHEVLPSKRKKFGFSRISLLVTKQGKKKKTSKFKVSRHV